MHKMMRIAFLGVFFGCGWSDEAIQTSETLTTGPQTLQTVGDTWLKLDQRQSTSLRPSERCVLKKGAKLMVGGLSGSPSGHMKITGQVKILAPTGEPLSCPSHLRWIWRPHYFVQGSEPATVERGKSNQTSLAGFIWPTQGRQIRSDSCGGGWYGAPRRSGSHKGLDIVASVGSPIKASRTGSIRKYWDANGYGNWLEINHSSGYTSRYAHLNAIYIKAQGSVVAAGHTVGVAGKTGNAAGSCVTPHLHFEIRRWGGVLNPKNLLI